MNFFGKVAICCLFLLAPYSLLYAESIQTFKASYVVQSDGTVLVRESIWYDFGVELRHGIFRTLETDHPQPATRTFYKRSVDIDVLEVKQNGESALYDTTESGGSVEVKIGDPDVYLTGINRYEITYLLSGALSYGTDGAELYWNVTGNSWQVPILEANALVSGDTESVLASQSACYQGVNGSDLFCTELSTSSQGTLFVSRNLGAYEGLTIAQEVNPAVVKELIIEKPVIRWMLWVLGLLWTVGLSMWAWRFNQANRSTRPVIAQYEPYEGFLPMYTGVLFDNRLDPQDITAGIIYLAEQGFITIKKTEQKVLWVFNTTDYELTLKRPLVEVPTDFLKEIMELLFEASAPVSTTVLLSTLAKKRETNSTIVLKLQASLRTDLLAQGFLESRYGASAKSIAKAFVLVWIPALTLFWYLDGLDDSIIALIVIVSVVTLIIYVLASYNRRSKKGHEALNHLEGFKLFLSVTEKDRLEFHNAPEKSPELFMKFLPYAIALKVEEKWSKVFEGITIPAPDWYQGGNIGTFSAVAFTSDVSAFSTSFSSSSGTSGSSGGGSSGGGGGGGGGGSW
jgi:uncharacterized membrane protein YgcG